MRKYFVLSAMLIATCGMFSSCSSDSDDGGTTGPAKTKNMTISIKGTPANMQKATGAVTPDTGNDLTEGTVQNLIIAIFDDQGAVDNIQSIDAPSFTNGTSEQNITYTCSTPTIVVVANAPKADFATATTLTTFKAVAAKLNNTTGTYSAGAFTAAPNTTDGQKGEFLPMMGQTSTISGTAPDYTASVNISRLVARVAIGRIASDFSANVTYSGYTLTIDQIFMYNVRTSMPFNGTVAASPVLYDGGLDWNALPAATTGTTTLTHSASGGYLAYLGTENLSDEGVVGKSVPYNTVHYYYVFPTLATDVVKLVIKATLTNGTDVQHFFYPIKVNVSQTGTTITGAGGTVTDAAGVLAANTTYTLSAVIKNKGVTDPNIDITPTDVTLTVNVQPWAANLTQETTFN